MVRQDEIQAHKELFEIYLEIRTALDVLHRANGGMSHGDLSLRGGQSIHYKRLNLGDSCRAEVLKEPLIALFEDGQLGQQALEPLLDVLLIFL